MLCINGKLLILREPINTTDRLYYMYDAANDTMELMTGDFDCLSYLNGRALQPTFLPNKYYVLGDQHTVGIFDTENYKFTEVAKLPICIYNNDYIWVDEQENKVYIVVNGDLISLPVGLGLAEKNTDMRIMMGGFLYNCIPLRLCLRDFLD